MVDLVWGRIWHRNRRRRAGWGLAFLGSVRLLRWLAVITAGVLLGWGISLEMRTSYLQSRIFARLSGQMTYNLEPGPSRRIVFPSWGPFNDRLGYVGLPSYIDSLTRHGFVVTRQARWSHALEQFVRLGFYPPYSEKERTGLRLYDREHNSIYSAVFPQRSYPDFKTIPPLVTNSLLFIEDHDLLAPGDPQRDPAIEWKRFLLAVAGRIGGWFDRRLREGGASTLSTQIEKFRHSPDGQTPNPREKLRQMISAAIAAYHDGSDTTKARQHIVTTYLDSTPLGSWPGYGEIIGLPEALWVWYGTEPAEADRVLESPAGTPAELARKGTIYRQILSLLLADRRPAYFLIGHHGALERLTDRYLRLLSDAHVISPRLRAAALKSRLEFRAWMQPPPRESYVANKATDRARDELVSWLDLPNFYALDRLDLNGETTIDTATQQRVTDVLSRLKDPAYDRSLGLYGKQLLGGGPPSKVAWSVVLYEHDGDKNFVRVHADSLDAPFDINSGAKLQLGSTAKLRTLVTYLDVIEKLHGQLASLSRPELVARAKAADAEHDALTKWAADYLAAARNRALKPMLDAAMLRTYSGSPQAFFTGGGLHAYANFEKSENSERPTVADGFARSINNVFVRIMRDLVNYYTAQSGQARVLSAAPDDPAREALLRRFVDQDSRTYMNRFYDTYHALSPDAALAKLAHRTRPFAKRLAVVFRSVRPGASREALGAFLHTYLPHEQISDDDLWDLYREYDVYRFSLEDRGYLAGIHPLELWLVAYLRKHPDASREAVMQASAKVRQQVYGWLFKGHSQYKQDLRLRILLEQDAFNGGILKDWRNQGYPFGHLVPSLGTAIGSSGDRPDALADLMGIIANDGVRFPTVDLKSLDFAKGTPYETDMSVEAKPQRVLSAAVAETVKNALLGPVRYGTAGRLNGVYRTANGGVLPVGGKTGTGDNRFDTFGRGGAIISQRVVDRTATFVFYLGDQFFGTVTAYVPGSIAREFHFTSAMAVQLLKSLRPDLDPLLHSAPPGGVAESAARPAEPVQQASSRLPPSRVESAQSAPAKAARQRAESAGRDMAEQLNAQELHRILAGARSAAGAVSSDSRAASGSSSPAERRARSSAAGN